jgi:hypothetical protein
MPAMDSREKIEITNLSFDTRTSKAGSSVLGCMVTGTWGDTPAMKFFPTATKVVIQSWRRNVVFTLEELTHEFLASRQLSKSDPTRPPPKLPGCISVHLLTAGRPLHSWVRSASGKHTKPSFGN